MPFQVCGVDYLGPLMVKDIYCKNGNDNMDRACIVIFTCTTSRSVILDLVEDNSSKNFTNSIKFITRRGCHVMVIEEDVVPRHKWRLGVVVELLEGTDSYVRGAEVKVGKSKNIIWCPVNRLYPTEVRWSDPREQNLSRTKHTINEKIDIQDNSKRTSRSRTA